MNSEKIRKYLLPTLALLVALLGWEAVVRVNHIEPVILPPPSLVLTTLIKDWTVLFHSLLVTLTITLQALIAATIGGTLLALVFARFRVVEQAFFPFAVILQVTPVISIAPLLLVYLSSGGAVLVCSFLVAFFPILSNTALGLSSVDHNLLDLFQMYRASGGQQLLMLRVPAALPYFLGGLRIGGGLALIGAIVAEIAAGSAGQGSGLAFRIIESGYRLNIPAHVRGARADLADRHLHLSGPQRVLVFASASLARFRAGPGVVTGLFSIAKSKRWAVADARVLGADAPRLDAQGFGRVDILVDEGRIAAVTPAGADFGETPRLPLGGRIALPVFVDAHTHLDKGHIWRARANPQRRFCRRAADSRRRSKGALERQGRRRAVGVFAAMRLRPWLARDPHASR